MVSFASISAHFTAAHITKSLLAIWLFTYYEYLFDSAELTCVLILNLVAAMLILVASFLIEFKRYGWAALVLLPSIALILIEMACIIAKFVTDDCDVMCKEPADQVKPSSPTAFIIRQDPCYERRFLIVCLLHEIVALFFVLCLEMMLLCCPPVMKQQPDAGRYLDKNLDEYKKNNNGPALSVLNNAKTGMPSTWTVNNTTSFKNYNFQLSGTNQRSQSRTESLTKYTKPDPLPCRDVPPSEDRTQSSIESDTQSGTNTTQSKSRSETPSSRASVSSKIVPKTI